VPNSIQSKPEPGQRLRNIGAGKAAPESDLLSPFDQCAFERVDRGSIRASDERNANRAKRTVVRMNHIALGDVDRAGERTGEHDLTSL
jgi:hypothetical protein